MAIGITYYSILGVKKDATQDEIKRAYRRLIMLCHPDKTGGEQHLYDIVTRAYEALSGSSDQQQTSTEDASTNSNRKASAPGPSDAQAFYEVFVFSHERLGDLRFQQEALMKMSMLAKYLKDAAASCSAWGYGDGSKKRDYDDKQYEFNRALRLLEKFAPAFAAKVPHWSDFPSLERRRSQRDFQASWDEALGR